MTLAADTTLAARTSQLRALRRLDGPTRLEMACRMSDDARSVSEAGIRHRHPGWSDREIQRALLVLCSDRNSPSGSWTLRDVASTLAVNRDTLDHVHLDRWIKSLGLTDAGERAQGLASHR